MEIGRETTASLVFVSWVCRLISRRRNIPSCILRIASEQKSFHPTCDQLSPFTKRKKHTHFRRTTPLGFEPSRANTSFAAMAVYDHAKRNLDVVSDSSLVPSLVYSGTMCILYKEKPSPFLFFLKKGRERAGLKVSAYDIRTRLLLTVSIPTASK